VSLFFLLGDSIMQEMSSSVFNGGGWRPVAAFPSPFGAADS
jgi:hypothetical protein